MRVCVIDGCDRGAAKRHLCLHHYNRAYRAGTNLLYPAMHPERNGFVNPLVCVCAVPDADPGRDFGMCQVCKRKPLTLMKAAL